MRIACAVVTLAVWLAPLASGADEVTDALAALQNVGAKGQGHREAAAAMPQLFQADADRLVVMIAALDDAGPVAENWIRGAVETVTDRHIRRGDDLPQVELEEFILDHSHSPRGRRLAYECLVRVDPSATERLMPGMLQDPSVELRRDAVARLLEEAQAHWDAKDYDAAAKIYTKALSGAVDQNQVTLIAERLKQLGRPVDLSEHFGFIHHWKLIGPFDNTDKRGFAVVYPPEEGIRLDATYRGKSGDVAWSDYATSEEYGLVDLNKALGKANGVTAYALCDFESPEARDVDVRVGSPNAVKIWLNGELLEEREAYHTNESVDQHIGHGRLKKGTNYVLIKVCQNEQTESWAQDWKFVARVCDAAGAAVLAANRKPRPKPTASVESVR